MTKPICVSAVFRDFFIVVLFVAEKCQGSPCKPTSGNREERHFSGYILAVAGVCLKECGLVFQDSLIAVAMRGGVNRCRRIRLIALGIEKIGHFLSLFC